MLILLDSNAIIHRAFHALPPLKAKDGTPTGAVYGFVLTLLSLLEKQNPTHLVAAFDLKGPTFRHEKFKDYKAKRVKAPDELYEQFPVIKEMLTAFGVPILEQKGFEADDIIGTIAKHEKSQKCLIATGDMDVLQLVDDHTKVFMLRKGIKDTVIYDATGVKEKYNLTPEQIVDYKALRGDPSDNIPGVAGVGEKTAMDLLAQFETLENVYENLEKIEKEAVKKKLEKDKKNAFLSYELATIKTDIDLDFDPKNCQTKDLNWDRLGEFFVKLGFKSLLKRIEDKMSQKPIEMDQEVSAKPIKINLGSNNEILTEIKRQKWFSYCLSEQGIGVSNDGEIGYYFDWDKKWEEIFKNDEILKIGYGVKGDLKTLRQNMNENFVCTKVLFYLLGSKNANDLEKLILEKFGAELEFKPQKNGQLSLFGEDPEKQKKFLVEKSVWISRLHQIAKQELGKISQEQKQQKNVKKDILWLWQNAEQPIKNILAQMELAGVKVEKEKLNEISKFTQEKLEKLEKEIHQLAGEEFNVNSSVQLRPILYEKLSISTVGIKRGKTGLSTNAEQLAKIRDKHPIVPLIEEYRELFKVKSTYTDALPRLVAEDGRIHANFNQTVTATGRLSSSEPNLQNIPKKGKLAKLIREAFVADKGKVLVAADYSQIDLRVAAHISEDPKMINIFQEGKDIHRATAAWVNGIKEEEISKKQRSEAKSLNFGVLYGMGVYGFMRDSGVSQERAQHFITHYMETFSGLKELIEETKKFAHEHGYVETELGRRRYITGIDSFNAQMKAAAERMAVNLPVQGLAADIMKLAMVKVNQEVLPNFNAQMILQIHDEMIFEVDKDQAEKFATEIKKIMELAYKLKVPLTVDVNQSENWGQL